MQRKLKIYGYCNRGYEGISVRINCDIHNGFPGFDIIGLPDKVINESKDLLRAALRNNGFKFPAQSVLVSLSPATVPKHGGLLSLGIALSILFPSNNKSMDGDEIRIMTAGELNLDGTIVEDYGSAGAVNAAKKLKCHFCLVPFEMESEENVICVKTLSEAFLKCGEAINNVDFFKTMSMSQKKTQFVFSDVIGMNREKEIMSISACGKHSILLFGPPGVGKTMLSNRLFKLLPEHSVEEQMVLRQIYGFTHIEDIDFTKSFTTIVPHDCSLAEFVGNAISKSPGLGGMSHLGVLLLDELDKFSPSLIEAVRDAYDKGYTISSKSGEPLVFPSRFLLTANMNACSCGNLGSYNSVCTCTSQKLMSYWNKIGKAMLERFSIRMSVPEYDIAQLSEENQKDDSYFTDKIKMACERQKKRLEGSNIEFNGEIRFAKNPFSIYRKETELYCKMFMDNSVLKNARFQLETIALARTIADYSDRELTTEEDFEKAMALRKYCSSGDYYWKKINK